MGGDVAVADAVAAAERAVALALASPRRAQELAAAVCRRDAAGPEARSLARRALGLASLHLGDLEAAERHLRRAVDLADAPALRRRGAEARMSLAWVLAYRGHTTAAFVEAERAARVLKGVEGARLEMQRALILQRLGRLDEALERYEVALVTFQEHGDEVWEARLRCNRGVLFAYRGDWAAAEADLRRAEELHQRSGQDLGAAQVRHNLGFVAALRGDVPGALAQYEAAEEELRRLATSPGVVLVDRAQLLLSVLLLEEARAAASAAVEACREEGNALDLAEARLVLAQAALSAGDAEVARDAADRAYRAMVGQGRQAWAALARYLVVRCDWMAHAPSPDLLAAARRAATDLEAAGWDVEAVDARLIAGRVALALGDRDGAAAELGAAARSRQRGPLAAQARAWHAEALRRLATGNRRGAEAALRAGTRAVRRAQALLGAIELRAGVAGHGGDLAATALSLAIEERRADRALAWAERWRAGSLLLPPARPPRDHELAAALSALRRATAAADQARLDGRDPGRLREEQARCEREVQRLTRRVAGDGARWDAAPPDASELREALGERALVELVELDGALHAVVVAHGRPVLRALGAVEAIRWELDALRFALRRLVRPGRSEASRQAAEQSIAAAGARLDELVLAPLRADVGDRPLVVVPTGTLHALPWAVLPSCRARPVTVAPSAAVWLRAERAHRAGTGTDGAHRQDGADGAVLLVAAPEPPHAAAEVADLAALYPDARVLSGPAATVPAVAAALDGAELAHVACHGRFRSGNPLFSALVLADGPLTVYDLEGLQRPPPLIVLSGCESGAAEVRPGDELMGLAAALLGQGARTLVCSAVPVPDAATRHLMVAFHRALRAGTAPAAALARAREELAGAEGPDAVAAAGFLCVGAG